MAGRLDQALGAVNGVNRDFATPAPYAPGSLVVFLNGQQLKRDLDNGWTELDPSSGTFRMKLPPSGPQVAADDPGDVLFCYYDTGPAVSVGGAGGGIPRLASALELRPAVAGAAALAPGMVSAVDRTAEAGVPLAAAEEVRPKTETANDLRPKLVKAEET